MSVNTVNQLGQQNIPQQGTQNPVNNSFSAPLLRIKSDAPSINNYFDIQGNIKDFAHFGDKYDNRAQDARMEKVCKVRDELQKLTDKYSNFNFNLAISLPEPNPSDFQEGKIGFDQYKEALKEWCKNCQTKFKEMENMLKHIDQNNNCVITIGNNNNVLVHIKNDDAQKKNIPNEPTQQSDGFTRNFSKFGNKANKAIEITHSKLRDNLINFKDFLKNHPNIKLDFKNQFPLPEVENFDEGEDGFNSYMVALNDWSQNCQNHLKRLQNMSEHIAPSYECIVTIGNDNNLLIEIPSEPQHNNNNPSLAASVNGNDNNIALVNDTTQVSETPSYTKNSDDNGNTMAVAEVSNLNEILVGNITDMNVRGTTIIASDNNFNSSVNPENSGNQSSLIVGNLDITASEIYVGGEGNNSKDIDGNIITPTQNTVIAGNLDLNAETVVVNEATITNDVNLEDSIEINGENNNVALVTNYTQTPLTNSGTFVGNITNTKVGGNAVILGNNNFVDSPQTSTKPDGTAPEPSKYQVKQGDLWVKIVKDQYGIAEGPELNALVSKVKADYYDANKSELTKQGYDSPKSGFLPKAGTTLELPQEIEINGNKYRLK